MGNLASKVLKWLEGKGKFQVQLENGFLVAVAPENVIREPTRGAEGREAGLKRKEKSIQERRLRKIWYSTVVSADHGVSTTCCHSNHFHILQTFHHSRHQLIVTSTVTEFPAFPISKGPNTTLGYSNCFYLRKSICLSATNCFYQVPFVNQSVCRPPT